MSEILRNLHTMHSELALVGAQATTLEIHCARSSLFANTVMRLSASDVNVSTMALILGNRSEKHNLYPVRESTERRAFRSLFACPTGFSRSSERPSERPVNQAGIKSRVPSATSGQIGQTSAGRQ